MLGVENCGVGGAGGDGSGDARDSGHGQYVEVTQKLEGEEVDDQEEDFAAVHMVFGEELLHLREKIIDYAMRNGDGTLCGKSIGNLRLVNKSWLVTVSKVLAKNHEPLYKVTLDKDSTPNGNQLVEVEVQDKRLDTFVTAVARRIERPFPTIRLRILEDFFEFMNYDSLYNFLRQCGQGVIEIELKIPRNGGSLPCIFPNVTLPELRKMKLDFTVKTVADPPDDSFLVPNSNNVTSLLQSLLNKNDSLQNLDWAFSANFDIAPLGLQYITLPSSITKLDLSCRMKGRQLEILTRNLLPHLTFLKLMISNTTYPEGLLTRIMGNSRKTLRYFHTNGIQHSGNHRLINLISFPAMEQLETLITWSINWELESDICAIDQCFPKLKNLTLTYQTQSMFHKWTSGLPSTNVVSLGLQLVNENIQHGKQGFVLPITLEDMQRVNGTFPNVKALTLRLTGGQTCGLKYMFMEMRQLEILEIFVYEVELLQNSDFWDSILTGIPSEIVHGMRMHPEFWNCIKFENEDMPSLKMLTGLNALSLKAMGTSGLTPLDGAPSLISDLAFSFAFMKMANLKKLSLSRTIKVSDATAMAWRNQGRKLLFTG